MEQPLFLTLDILDLRAYARAKSALDNAKDKDQVPTGPMVDLVWEVMAELHRRRLEEHRAKEKKP